MTESEPEAIRENYRRITFQELVPPSLKIIKRVIEDPDPRKASANLREIEKSLGIRNLRARIVDIYMGNPQERENS